MTLSRTRPPHSRPGLFLCATIVVLSKAQHDFIRNWAGLPCELPWALQQIRVQGVMGGPTGKLACMDLEAPSGSWLTSCSELPLQLAMQEGVVLLPFDHASVG